MSGSATFTMVASIDTTSRLRQQTARMTFCRVEGSDEAGRRSSEVVFIQRLYNNNYHRVNRDRMPSNGTRGSRPGRYDVKRHLPVQPASLPAIRQSTPAFILHGSARRCRAH